MRLCERQSWKVRVARSRSCLADQVFSYSFIRGDTIVALTTKIYIVQNAGRQHQIRRRGSCLTDIQPQCSCTPRSSTGLWLRSSERLPQGVVKTEANHLPGRPATAKILQKTNRPPDICTFGYWCLSGRSLGHLHSSHLPRKDFPGCRLGSLLR